MDWITNLRDRAPGMRPQARSSNGDRTQYIRNADDDTAEILIYEEISDWWGVCAADIIHELRSITAPNILVRINSPGGSVFEGIAIANALRAHPGNVVCQVDGIAASIASVIALAGDQLVMAPHSQLMIHEASGCCYGSAADMQAMATLLDLQSDNLADVYAEKAGGTREQWRELMRTETWYLAQEAVDAGLADVVAPGRSAPPAPIVPEEAPELDEPEMRDAWDLSVFRYAGREEAPAPQPVAAAAPVEPVPPVSVEAVVPEGQPVTGPVDGPSSAPVTAPSPADDTPSIVDGVEPVTSVNTPVTPVTDADPWAELTAHLTQPISADQEFARLKEALCLH